MVTVIVIIVIIEIIDLNKSVSFPELWSDDMMVRMPRSGRLSQHSLFAV